MALRVEEGVAYLDGQVGQAEVTGLLAAGEAAIAGGCEAFDLGGVAKVDSAALSLILAWQRRAAARGRTLALRNIPDNIRSLVELYGVGDLIAAA